MGRKKIDMIEITNNDVLTVETWNGKSVLKEDCKRIDGQYYQINVDCFLIINKQGVPRWNRINNGRIAWDAELNRFDLIERLREKAEYTEGIINEKGERGWFIANPYKNVLINENIGDDEKMGTLCFNEHVAIKLGYKEYFGNGIYVKNVGGMLPGHLKRKDIYKYPNMKKLAYNADDNNKIFLDVIKEHAENKNKIILDEHTVSASKLIGGLSWGIEFESCGGIIPRHLLGPLGLVPLKDGSLRDAEGREPYEYATIPMSGALGLQSLKLQCEELTKRCALNEKCSMHIHIGSIKTRSMEFVLAMYKLCYNIQNEMFELFPEYKKNPEKLGLHKNYCQMLPCLDFNQYDFKKNFKTSSEAKSLVKQVFDRFYYWVNDNVLAHTNEDWNLNTFQHPKGQMDKWGYNARYHWINFNNYIFSRRATLEFRIHTPTFSFTKTSNWLFICAAIVQFAECYTNEILKDEVPFSLEFIINSYRNSFGKSFYQDDYSEQVAAYLNSYIKMRKECMKKDLANNNIMGESIEFKKDGKFSFISDGLTTIY